MTNKIIKSETFLNCDQMKKISLVHHFDIGKKKYYSEEYYTVEVSYTFHDCETITDIFHFDSFSESEKFWSNLIDKERN